MSDEKLLKFKPKLLEGHNKMKNYLLPTTLYPYIFLGAHIIMHAFQCFLKLGIQITLCSSYYCSSSPFLIWLAPLDRRIRLC